MRTYRNPVKKKEDMADPFVLRYNGKYYLYCTRPGVPCWSSENLIDWKPEGFCVPEEEFPGLVPFAPEVVYWNGTFYMYTSPHGLGHYVLTSACPAGPFHKITGNIGHSIDISVFIDDDGAWYAYWADDRGIVGCKMNSPTEFGEEVLVGAFMHGWTEGPFVVKKDGRYHLTYTGNHYLSKGYRINAAVSEQPLGPYLDHVYNPVIVRTEGEVTGLGHSSTILGPDLHTHYIVYHNLNPDHTRDMNMDPVVFRQKRAYILGPTTALRPAPAEAAWRDPFDCAADRDWQLCRGSWEEEEGFRVSAGAFCAVNKAVLPENGIAEFHVAALAGTMCYGLIFPADTPDNIFGGKELRLEMDAGTNRISLRKGTRLLKEAPLLDGHSHEALHAIRLEYGSSLTVYIDGLKRLEAECDLGGRCFGYYGDGKLRMGSTAFQSSEMKEPSYPVPCTAPGGENITFDVEQRETYQFQAIGCKNTSGALVIDGREAAAEAMDHENGVLTFLQLLDAGEHTLDARGSAADYIIINRYYGSGTEPLSVNNLGPYDKYLGTGKQTDGQFHVYLKMAGCAPGWQAGVLMRASQPADGGEGCDKRLGTNFFIGYRVCVTEKKLQLWKHRYDERLLAEAGYSYENKVDFQVKMEKNHIAVIIDDEALFTFWDPEPVMCGHLGFHTRDCVIKEGRIW